MRFNWQGLTPHTSPHLFHILLEGEIIFQRAAVTDSAFFHKKSEALNSHYDPLSQRLTGDVLIRAYFLCLAA